MIAQISAAMILHKSFLSHDGDRINALLAAADHNLRLILRKLRLLFVLILAELLKPVAKQDTWTRLPGIQKSIA